MDKDKEYETKMKVIEEEKKGIDDYIKLYPILKPVLENKEVYELIRTIVHRATGSGFNKGYAFCMKELIEKMGIKGYFECGESELINRLKDL